MPDQTKVEVNPTLVLLSELNAAYKAYEDVVRVNQKIEPTPRAVIAAARTALESRIIEELPLEQEEQAMRGFSGTLERISALDEGRGVKLAAQIGAAWVRRVDEIDDKSRYGQEWKKFLQDLKMANAIPPDFE